MSALTYEELCRDTDLDLGNSRWLEVDQRRIDQFADISEDHQWIHTDTLRAKEGPYGATIAHGYLTITLIGTLLGELLRVEPSLVMINYGVDRVRFIQPVLSGSLLRASASIARATESANGLRLSLDVTGEIYGAARPACKATSVILVARSEATTY